MKKTIVSVLVLACMVRLAGVAYGLPLWLIDDEPPFILAALKMLELKTVLPVLHLEAFQSVLYYPPYLSYLLLLPFALAVGVKLIFFGGPSALFASYLLSDLSVFFVIGRLCSILAGTYAVYLLYRIGEHLFPGTKAGLFSAFFSATSLITVALSMTSRHWMSVFLCTTLVLYFLSHPAFTEKKRYLLATITAGIGVGFAIVNVFSALLIALWCVLYERKKLMGILRNKFYWGIALLFSCLALLPVLLYPKGLGFTADTTAGGAKSFLTLLFSPLLFANTILVSEPVLLLFALVGLCLMWKRARNLFWTAGIYIFLYSVIFYLLFRFEQRFLMGLLPLYFVLAGFGFNVLVSGSLPLFRGGELERGWNKRIYGVIFSLLLLIPLSLSLRLGYLASYGDSRFLALRWATQHIPKDSKVLVLARLTAFPMNAASLAEQEALDPVSIRKVNRAQAEMSEKGSAFSFHTLNLSDVSNDALYAGMTAYAKEHAYEYLIIQPTYPRAESFTELIAGKEPLISFPGVPRQTTVCQACGSAQTTLSLAESQFIANPFLLFTVTELGPPIEIYRLNSPFLPPKADPSFGGKGRGESPSRGI